MKLILICFVTLTLVACGSKGGGASPAAAPVSPTEPLDPSCKPIESVWTSDSDLERHDFSGFTHGVTTVDYEFRGSDGAVCGYSTNPNHELNAGLEVPSDYGLSGVEWNYRLFLNYSLAIGGTCGTYGSSPADPTQVAFIKFGCNSLEICRGSNTTQLSNCKSFH